MTFRNDVPKGYRLERVRITVDGVTRYDGRRAGTAPVAAGSHVIAVVADYRMHDPVLTYTRDFGFEVRAAERVKAWPGRVVLARAVEVGGVTRPAGQRVQILWH